MSIKKNLPNKHISEKEEQHQLVYYLKLVIESKSLKKENKSDNYRAKSQPTMNYLVTPKLVQQY